MVKKKNYSKLKNASIITFWLLFSGAGMVLFAFGLKDWFEIKTWANSIPVITGAVMTFCAIILNQFRTETSVAMKKKRL